METTPRQITPRSNPEISPSNKKFHKFLIFSPVLLLFTFILLVYVTYIVTYIIPLIHSTNNLNTTFPFIATTSIGSAFAKGITLLVFISFCFLMLFISMIRVAAMDPGYFPDPTELEGKLLAKQINKGFIRDFTKEKEWSDYVRKFGEVLEKAPLTFQEGHEVKRTVVFKPFQKNLIELLEEPQFRVKEILTFRTDELFKSEENQLQEENQAINYNDLFENFKATDLFAIPLCSQCLRWKIERSHHCRQCGKCVLKMDHHCPWLANCIGFRNYKYFCLVALYGLFSSLIVASTFWEAVYSYYNSTNFIFACFIIYSYVCNLGLLCFVVWLFFYNTPLLFKNQTLIENSDFEKFPVSARVRNPYNVGKYRNFTSVFGNNPLLWLLPFSANYEGEGLVFAKNKTE